MKMHTKLLGSAALSALLMVGLTGCGDETTTNSTSNTYVTEATEEAAVVGAETITPYTRVAVIPNADWTAVQGIAEKIAKYVVYTDESNITSNGVMQLPTNWVIAGANGGADGLSGPETWSADGSDLLPIPGMGSAVTGTSRVIEFCNRSYALQAVGTGRFHGSALPCEVSVHSDGTNVYVDMLDAEAIFNIFFTDATDNFGATENAAFAAMAAAVKSELRTMIRAGLNDDGGLSESANVQFTELYEELGPQFTQDKIENDIAFRNPYIVYEYERSGGGTFTKGTDDDLLAKAIIGVLGTASNTADNQVVGLSAASEWRSGRPEPIAIPNVKVVEACSPKYAKKATTLGNEYITALPCEFTVFVDENNASKLSISFLNPNFMFGTMFEGAVQEAYDNNKLTKAEVIEYSTLADVVFGDLRMIVDQAVQDAGPVTHGLGLKITE